jgi:hypothetical protein
MNKYLYLLLLLVTVFSSNLRAQNTLELGQVYLYLPDEAMESRIVDGDKFVKYIASAIQAAIPALDKFKTGLPVSGGIIITVRPEKDVKIWFDIRTGSLGDNQKKAIENAVLSIPVEGVKKGIVPFAVAFKAFGAKSFIDSLPIAPEWRHSSKSQEKMEISKLIELAWRNQDLGNR